MRERTRAPLARKRFTIVLTFLVLAAFVIAPALVSANVGTGAVGALKAPNQATNQAAAKPAVLDAKAVAVLQPAKIAGTRSALMVSGKSAAQQAVAKKAEAKTLTAAMKS